MADVLQDLLRRLERETRADCDELTKVWDQVVGPDIAAWSRPLWIRENELLVQADNNAVMDVLRYRKAAVMEQANALLGKTRIAGIKIRLGG